MLTMAFKLPARLLPLLAVFAALLTFTGCDQPVPGALVRPPVGVHYSTGDPHGLTDEQLGLEDSRRTRAELLAAGELSHDGAVHVACGPAPHHPEAFRLRLTAEDPATLDLTLVIPHFDHFGTHEAEAHVARLGPDGTLLMSSGDGTVEIAPAVLRAGRHAASGSFTAEVAGEAGSGVIEGRFESCSYFS